MLSTIPSTIREGFARDLLVTLAATVLLGAAVAGGVASTVDTYLARQVTGVLGDLGEYDLILHVREEAREPARSEIEKVLASSFAGARVKEGPTVIGKANFFISLPEERRNRSGLEGLARALADVPGASGETYIIEPRLSVGGIEPGAFHFVMGKAEKLPGVRFCFRDGGTLAIVLDSAADVGRVSEGLKRLLAGYSVVEVRFPIGQELADSVGAGAAYADDLVSSAGASLSLDITRRGSASDLADLSVTLNEMRRFLERYAAWVTISIEGDAPLRPGDTVFLEIPRGENLDHAGVLVQVKEVQGKEARGIVVEGDTGSVQTPSLPAFLADAGGRPQRKVGRARVTSESKRLAHAADESVRLLRELEAFRDDAYRASLSALDVLAMYDTTVGRLVDVQRALETASEALGASDGALGSREAAAVEKALRDAMGVLDELDSALGNLGPFESEAKKVLSALASAEGLFNAESGTSSELSPAFRDVVAALRAALDLAGAKAVERARAIDEFLGDIGPVAAELARWKATLSGLTGRVSSIRALLATGRAGGVVSGMLDATNTLLAQAQAMDVPQMQGALRQVSEDLEAVRDVDTGSIIRELEYIKASLPNLRDDEVGRSIRLIERYIGGEVIPGDSLQILVDNSVGRAEAEEAARKRFGPEARAYVSPVGVAEPGVRSQVYGILHEARTTVAALCSFVLAFVVLALDHAVVVSAIREFGRGRAQRRRRSLLDAGSLYAMAVGAAVLLPVFVMSGAKVPYLGAGHVALLGAVMGYLVSAQSERISPVSGEEIVAGMAMGLSHTAIMREIVVPSSRPGMLSLLNRGRLKFRGCHGHGATRAGKRRRPHRAL